MSDTNENDGIGSDKNRDTEIMSDTKAVPTAIMSDTNTPLPETVPPPHRKGRAPGAMRQRILTLLEEHTEGLNAMEIRTYLRLDPGQDIGDTLQGMRRSGVVTTQGTGQGTRYFAAHSTTQTT